MTAGRHGAQLTRRPTQPLPQLGPHDAACASRPDLPWIADVTPSRTYQAEMAALCRSCPLTRACASQAIRDKPVGFYAGVWVAGVGKGRSHALQILHHIATKGAR